MAELLNKIPTNLTEYPNSFKRQGCFPLEAYSVFYATADKTAFEAAQDYATNNGIAYVGQTLAVVTTNAEDTSVVDSVVFYIIADATGTLQEVGKITEGDGKSIDLSEDGTLSLYGFDNAGAATFPRKNSDGKIEWVSIENVVEGDGNDKTVLQLADTKGILTLSEDKSEGTSTTTYTLGLENIYNATEVDENFATKQSLENIYNNINQKDQEQDQRINALPTEADVDSKISEAITGLATESYVGSAIGYALSQRPTEEEINNKINDAINAANHLTKKIVTAVNGNTVTLSDGTVEEAVENVIYMLKHADLNLNDIYDEYTIISEVLTLIGSTSVDLSGYVNEDLLNETLSEYAKTEDIPVIPESVVGEGSAESRNDSSIYIKGNYFNADQTPARQDPVVNGIFSVAEGFGTTIGDTELYQAGDDSLSLPSSSKFLIRDGKIETFNYQSYSFAHAEGNGSTAAGSSAHAEGELTYAKGRGSHAEGRLSGAYSKYSHAEGKLTKAGNSFTDWLGIVNENYPSAIFESNRFESANRAFIKAQEVGDAKSWLCLAYGTKIIPSWTGVIDPKVNAFFEYIREKSNGADHSFFLSGSAVTQKVQNMFYTTLSTGAHAEGIKSTAIGDGAHAEGATDDAGNGTIAKGNGAHAEGCGTQALVQRSHAEGYMTTASADSAHAEGFMTTASGNHAHAEGNATVASGKRAHAEGQKTTASGDRSHAEGEDTVASAHAAHAGGLGTIASMEAQTAIGKYNEEVVDAVFIIGNGTDSENRKNLLTAGTDLNGDYLKVGHNKVVTLGMNLILNGGNFASKNQ